MRRPRSTIPTSSPSTTSGEEPSFPYIVMELVDGDSLRRMLGAPLPAEPLLHLAVQLADGLVGAHERNIVHGDLKPENLLVTRQGILKILDFGLAVASGARERRTPASDAGARPAGRWARRATCRPRPSRPAPATRARTSSRWAPCSTRPPPARVRSPPGRSATLALTVACDPPDFADSAARPRPRSSCAPSCVVSARTRRSGTPRRASCGMRCGPLVAAGRRRSAWPCAGRPLLPAQRTRLIGRDREVAEIERLLAGDARLLTPDRPRRDGQDAPGPARRPRSCRSTSPAACSSFRWARSPTPRWSVPPSRRRSEW